MSMLASLWAESEVGTVLLIGSLSTSLCLMASVPVSMSRRERRRRQLMDAPDQWRDPSTQSSWQETHDALEQWADTGRIDRHGRCSEPLPLGWALNREALADWMVMNRNTDVLPHLDWNHVERNAEGSVVWVLGTDPEPMRRLVARRDKALRKAERAYYEAVHRVADGHPVTTSEFNTAVDALNRFSTASTVEVERDADEVAALFDRALASSPQQEPDGARLANELRARITEVLTDAERRHLDIMEVIEHNALFQLTDPVTAEFERYAIEVRDTPLAFRTAEQLRPMVAKLETLWKAAVQNAERRGLSALSDPALGSTAVKLARTAADTGATKAERANARAKLEGALGELGLPVEPRMLDGIFPLELTHQPLGSK